MAKKKKRTSKIYRVPGFEYGYIRSPSEMVGRMEPFRPHWWAQYQGDGTFEIFDTKAECLAWIKGWDEIGE